ncbi:MAG: T9SS type A sorting domain-containing protein [Calditrichaceae bacterium]
MPIGFELQVTIWAYKYKANLLGNSIFKRYRLINKSIKTIDSMYIGQFADIEIGHPGNEFSGCDSILNMGYIYNEDKIEEDFSTLNIIPPPAVGYILLQGPMVESHGKQANFDFKPKMNYTNLPMIAFWYKGTGMGYTDPDLGNFNGTLQAYNLLRGYVPNYDIYNPSPYYHGSGNYEGTPTKFPVNGDPVTGLGDIDGEGNNVSAGSRRFVISSGPFTMAPGDTQDIALAIVGGLGPHDSSNVSSVAKLQEYAPLLHSLWQSFNDFEPPKGPVPGRENFNNSESTEYPVFMLGQNYPNPFNNVTNIRFRLLGKMDVRLSIYNINGQLNKNIYRGTLEKDDYNFKWDGKDNNGKILPSGIYFLHMQCGLNVQTKKLIMIK